MSGARFTKARTVRCPCGQSTFKGSATELEASLGLRCHACGRVLTYDKRAVYSGRAPYRYEQPKESKSDGS